MSTHLFSSRQACMSCLNEGGEVRKVGKGSVFFCLQRIDLGRSPVSMGGGVQLNLAISKVFDAKWSFSGAQTWQPCSGQQVVPPANILAIVLSWVATSTSSYRDNVLFLFIILFTKLSFVWGSVMVQMDRG